MKTHGKKYQAAAKNRVLGTAYQARQALEIVKRYVIGPPFTPPSVIGEGPNAKLGTIQLAGASGGANWNGGAFDPETGMFYVGSRTVAFGGAVYLLE